MSPQIVCETERLFLRRWTTDDVALLYPILSDPITMQFWPAPLTIDATRAWIDRALHNYASLGFGRFAVVLKKSGAVIGDCGLMHTEVAGQPEYDLGYIIHHPYWRQGFATEAATACRDYAFTTLGIRRLVANMAVDHIASMSVAKLLGMRLERVFANPRNRNMPTYLYVREL